MKKEKTIFSKLLDRPYLFLLILFIVTVDIRTVLVFRSSVLPSIMVDELRNFSIASSIISKGKILIEGQPVTYGYILYPLLIAPLFKLPVQVNIYRAIELFNVICLASAYFPAYKLALKITGKRKTSLLLASMLALFPDAIMARHVMVECVALPLMLWAFILAFEVFQENGDLKKWIMLGVVGFLLYTLKPVYVCFGGACVLVSLFYSYKEKSKELLYKSILLAVDMIVLWLFFQISLRLFLSYNPSNTALFAEQTHPFNLQHIVQTLDGLGKYFYYILLDFGIIPIAIAVKLSFCKQSKNAKIALIVLLSTVLSVICVVYMFYVDELINQGGIPLRIHTRYIFMYLPVFFMLMFDEESKSFKSIVIVILAFIVIGLCSYDINDVIYLQRGYPVDNLLGSSIHYSSNIWNGVKMWKPFYLGILIPLCVFICLKGFNKKTRTVFFVFIAIALLFNQYCGYKRDYYGLDYSSDADAKQVADIVRGTNSIYVCEDDNQLSIPTTAIVVHTRGQVPVISYKDLIENTRAYGVIDTIFPSNYANYVYTTATYEYECPHYVVFEASLLGKMVINTSKTTIFYTDNGKYAVVLNTPNEPLIHSALYSYFGNVNDTSRFVLFDKALQKANAIKLQLKACCNNNDEDCKLTVSLNNQEQTVVLTKDYVWYDFIFNNDEPDGTISVKLSSNKNSAYLSGYLISGFYY